MAFNRETLLDTRRLLEAGRKADAKKNLQYTIGLSGREAEALIRLFEQELGKKSETPTGQYKATPMDGPLKAGVATLLLDKGKLVEAIDFIKSHRKITLAECMTMIEEVEKEFGAQYQKRSKTNIQLRRFPPLLFIPLAIGVAFSAFSAYLLYTQHEMIASSDRIIGQVVDMHYQYKGGSAPIIEFDWEGQKLIHQSSIHSKNPVYSINEDVPLYVNRTNPKEVIIDTFVDRWSIPGILGLIGSIALLMTLLVAWFTMRR
jgi:hypothetical protein